jgi:hypothetical protein
VDGLRRLREPAAISVIAALLIQVLIAWVGYVAYGTAGSPMPETLTILVLALIVASCVLGQRSAHARMLTVAALIVSVLSILTSVTLGIIAPVTGPESLVIFWLDLLLDLVVPVLVVVGLATLLGAQRAPADTAPESPAIVPAASIDPAPAAMPSSQLEPVWPPDEASGAAWHTAGDAALGAPATGWGTPGESGGWQAIDDEEDPSSPDRPGPES